MQMQISAKRLVPVVVAVAVAAVVIPAALSAFRVSAQSRERRATPLELKGVTHLSITPDNQYVVMLDSRGKVSKAQLPSGQPVSLPAEVTYAPRRFPSGYWGGAPLHGGDRNYPDFNWATLSLANGLALAEHKASYDAAIFDMDDPLARIAVLPGTSDQEFTLAAFSPDRRYLATGHHQGLVRLWDVASGRLLRDLRSGRRLSLIAFSPDGKRVIVGDQLHLGNRRPVFEMWEASTGRSSIGLTAESYSGDPTSVAFSEDGLWVIGGRANGKVTLWNSLSGERVCEFHDFGHAGPISTVGISRNSQYAFASNSGSWPNAYVWDMADCLVRYLYPAQLEKERVASKLFDGKGEFETTEQYNQRIVKSTELDAELISRYATRYQQDIQARTSAIDVKIRASAAVVTLKISELGTYDADKQVFPVTIGEMIEMVRVPIADAADFKARYLLAKVAGIRRLQRDLVNFEHTNIKITLPTTGVSYAFGRQE